MTRNFPEQDPHDVGYHSLVAEYPRMCELPRLPHGLEVVNPAAQCSRAKQRCTKTAMLHSVSPKDAQDRSRLSTWRKMTIRSENLLVGLPPNDWSSTPSFRSQYGVHLAIADQDELGMQLSMVSAEWRLFTSTSPNG